MRTAATLATWLAVTAALPAHFVFVVPEGTAGKVKVVFSDSLEADKRVDMKMVGGTKLTTRDQSGQETPLTLPAEATAEAAFDVELPGSGKRVVGGSVALAGVRTRGSDKPFVIRYHPKAVVGELSAEVATLGPKVVPVEIVPVQQGAKLRFQAQLNGKPLPKAAFGLLEPERDARWKTGECDEQGMLPGEFERPGKYAVRVLHREPTAGDEGGKRYEEVRHYATLVVEVPAGK